MRVYMSRWAACVLATKCDIRRELEKILKEKDKQKYRYRGWCCDERIFVGMRERRETSERIVSIG